MGYDFSGGGRMNIRKENFQAIVDAAFQNFPWLLETCGLDHTCGLHLQSGVDEILENFDFDVLETDEDGNITWAYVNEGRLDEQYEFLKSIAPYVENGSYMEFEGEDRERWLWAFKDHRLYECDGKTVYPGDPYEGEEENEEFE